MNKQEQAKNVEDGGESARGTKGTKGGYGRRNSKRSTMADHKTQREGTAGAGA